MLAFRYVMPMKGLFREAVSPQRLVFSGTAMEDAAGNPQLETLNTVTFEEQSGKTKLTLHAVVIKSTPETANAVAGMEQDWSDSLGRFGAKLAA